MLAPSLRNAFQANGWDGVRLIASLRYVAMAGLVASGLHENMQAEALEDRKAFGPEYLGEKNEIDALSMIRFMVDICDLPYNEAHLAAQERLTKMRVFGPPIDDPGDTATMLYEQCGDIFASIENAKFFASISPNAQQWERVVHILQHDRMENPRAWAYHTAMERC